jgi:hypothetical protein
MKKHISISFFLLIAQLAFSQGFEFGGVFDASANSTVIVDHSKIDNSGNTYILGRFSGTVDLDPTNGVSNFTGNVITFNPDYFLVKLSPTNQLQWIRTWQPNISFLPSLRMEGLAVDDLGNAYLAGFFRGSIDFDPNQGFTILSNGFEEAFVLSISNIGMLNWVRRTQGTSGGYFNDLDVSGNTLFLLGYFSGGNDINTNPLDTLIFTQGGQAVISLNTSGNFLTANIFPNTSAQLFTGLNAVTATEYLLFGFPSSTFDIDPNPSVITNFSPTHPPIGGNGISDFVFAKFSTVTGLQWYRQLSLVTNFSLNDQIIRYIFNSTSGVVLSINGINLITGIDLDPSSNQVLFFDPQQKNSALAQYDINGNYIRHITTGIPSATLGNIAYQKVSFNNSNIQLMLEVTNNLDINPTSGVFTITNNTQNTTGGFSPLVQNQECKSN